MCSIIILLFFLAFSLTLSRGTKKCRALVLQGGGDKGAYQVGALSEMLRLIPDDIHYDVVSGVSAGALNAGGFSQFPPGEEAQAVEFLLDIWRNIHSDNVFTEWPGGIIDGLFYEPSLFDTSPLADFLDKKLSHPMARKLNIGAVDANTGRYVRFNESLKRDALLTVVRASAALPALFPYIEIDGGTYIDGGVLLGLDVDGAIERCREIVNNDADIIVDILLCSGDILPKIDQNEDKTLQMLGRFIHITLYSTALNHLLHALEDNPDIFFRYVIMPSKSLASEPLPLQFDPVEIEDMIQTGIEDARDKILNKTFGMKDIEEKWRLLYNKPKNKGRK